MPRQTTPGRITPRGRARAFAALALGGVLMLTACTGGGGGGDRDGGAGASPGASSAPVAADPARVTITPANGSKGIEPTDPVTIEIGAEDRLGDVVVTNLGSGQKVDGGIQPDGRTWKPAQPFSLGGTYSVTAVATNKAGAATTATAGFDIRPAGRKVTATHFPEDGQTVGVGQPVSITFDAPVKDKAAAERAMTVTATPAVRGAWHWFDDKRADYRPRDYWPTGTTVKVDLHLRAVNLGGTQPPLESSQFKTFTFTISPDKIVTEVDVRAYTMTTFKNDQPVKTIPITAGEEPKYSTWNGIMVVQEKYPKTRMDSQTVGLGKEYDIPKVPWAVRITTSGTFVHGNDWEPDPAGTFGKRNASHGCVSMIPENAKWFYDNAARPGDIVKVSGSRGGTVRADNGYGAWNLTWEQWLAKSATGEH